MPLVSDSGSFTLDHFYDRTLLAEKNWTTERSLATRLQIARNLSMLLADLHAQGHCVIDFKPQNIKVYRATSFVALLDCDSYSIQAPSAARIPATHFSSEYIAPEALKSSEGPERLGLAQDFFALAVVLFQLLNNGIHPFQGRQTGGPPAPTADDKVRNGLYPHGVVPNVLIQPRPDSIHQCWDEETRNLFDRAFTAEPQRRPSAGEWGQHFHNILEQKRLERCSAHPNDAAHIRFLNKPCGTCHLEKTADASAKVGAQSNAVGEPDVKPPPTYNKVAPYGSSRSTSSKSAAAIERDSGRRLTILGLSLGFLALRTLSMTTGPVFAKTEAELFIEPAILGSMSIAVVLFAALRRRGHRLLPHVINGSLALVTMLLVMFIFSAAAAGNRHWSHDSVRYLEPIFALAQVYGLAWYAELGRGKISFELILGGMFIGAAYEFILVGFTAMLGI
jgi:serine/threonine protein kinase